MESMHPLGAETIAKQFRRMEGITDRSNNKLATVKKLKRL